MEQSTANGNTSQIYNPALLVDQSATIVASSRIRRFRCFHVQALPFIFASGRAFLLDIAAYTLRHECLRMAAMTSQAISCAAVLIPPINFLVRKARREINMSKSALSAIMILSALVTGCTARERWAPDEDVSSFTQACQGKRALAVEEATKGAVTAAYNFVIDEASDRDLLHLVEQLSARGFSLVPMTVQLNGRDTLFATGPGILQNQSAIDAEFITACEMGQGSVYLTHARYNPATHGGPVQVR